MANFEGNDTEGIISKAAAKRIEKAIVWLLFHSKQKFIYDVELKKRFHFRINFITLTLPAAQFFTNDHGITGALHSDDEIKKVCLNNFLNLCRQQFGLKNYVWKAEAQLNGNIHFHLVTDTYIRYDRVQELWNQSVELLGYVTRFKEKIGHSHPNSTDIHSVKHVKKIANYVSKYMSKNRAFKCIGELRNIQGKTVEIYYGTDQYRREAADKKEGKVIGHIIDGPIRKIEGRLWFLSRSLSKCKPIRINETDYQFEDLQTVIQKGDLFQFNTDFCFNYYGKVASACKNWAPWLYQLMKTNPEEEKQ